MYICMDLGGTNVRGTWIDKNGKYGEVVLNSRPRTLQGSQQALISLVQSLKDQAPGEVSGIGLATAGPLDHIHRRYLKTSNMPELDYFQVGDFLEDKFDIPVIMENDAQAAALGEVWNGGLAGEKDAVVLTLGTGIGSGVIKDGVIWRGGHFTGPELGHLYLGPGRGKECGCGQVGCAETWMNKSALTELFQQEGYAVSELKDMNSVVRKADAPALRVMKIYGRRLGLYLSMLCVVFGFENFGLSGGLSSFIPDCEQYVWETIKHRLKYRQWWIPKRIVASPCPEMSGLFGMARAWILAEQSK